MHMLYFKTPVCFSIQFVQALRFSNLRNGNSKINASKKYEILVNLSNMKHLDIAPVLKLY